MPNMGEPGDLRKRLRHLATVLEGLFGHPRVRFDADPLDALIGTILSQSTNDANSGRAYDSLRLRFPTWEDALEAGPGEIERAIRSGGLARQKSTRLHAILRQIKEERGTLSLDDLCTWSDDEAFSWLGRFKGVGPKTVAIVLLFACGRDLCPVDTHVHRIVRRLGLVRQKASAGAAFETLRPHIPRGKGASLHLNLVRFGRTRCTARSPACRSCPLNGECLYDKTTGTTQTRSDGKRQGALEARMVPFVVTFWSGVPPQLATLDRYREIADAGFTVAQVSGTPAQIRQQLDWCREVGITGMVIDGRMPGPDAVAGRGWKDGLAAIVSDYRAHPALWGYYVTDEPNASQFAGLAKIVAVLKRLDPAHPSYINLFPNYASEQQLGTKTYAEHIERYIAEVKPPLVSWDFYGLNYGETQRDGYFANLRCVRDRSLAAGLDFWQIYQCTPFHVCRDPSEAEFRWQAWTTLAYGAKGISYFTYWTPDTENFRDGVIGLFGERTHHYPIVQKVNREILAMGTVLSGLRSVGLVHGGPWQSDPPRYLVGPPEPDLIVGEFERPGGDAALIVVNDDFTRPVGRGIIVRPEFAAARLVARSTGHVTGRHQLPEVPNGRRLGVWLAPGDGAIVLLER